MQFSTLIPYGKTKHYEKDFLRNQHAKLGFYDFLKIFNTVLEQVKYCHVPLWSILYTFLLHEQSK